MCGAHLRYVHLLGILIIDCDLWRRVYAPKATGKVVAADPVLAAALAMLCMDLIECDAAGQRRRPFAPYRGRNMLPGPRRFEDTKRNLEDVAGQVAAGTVGPPRAHG